MIAAMAEKCRVTVASTPAEAMDRIAATETPFELIVVSFDQSSFDGLRLCSQIRSGDATRQIPTDDHRQSR